MQDTIKQDNSANSKRIAKNTFMLYIRMFVMMVIALYTSRVVLDTLGAEDYGIYNVIGGVVVLFSFMNSALLQATQRFLNFELGKNDANGAHEVFCMSMNSYIILSAIFIVVAETVGLWLVNSQLNIPETRTYAANWVYQLSIITFVINLIRVPYNAAIIAYEKMGFFAYLSIFEVVLKLLVVYLIIVCSFDKLIFFAVLYTLIPLLTTYMYKWYCNRHFKITKYQYYWNKSIFKQLFTFSGWSLFGSIANMFASQGLVILVNIFHGVVANAALGIANQISAKVTQFFTNFQMAFNPQIVKKYAADETESLFKLIYSTSKFSYYIMFIVSLPLIIKMDVILSLWLVDVPRYTTEFSQLILIFMLIEALSAPLWMYVQATGEIKTYQILMGIVIFFNFPLAYIVLKMGLPVYSVWIIRILVNILTFVVRCLYIQRKYSFPLGTYISKVVIPIILVTIIVVPIPVGMDIFITQKWMGLIITLATSLFISLIIIYMVGMSANEKNLLNNVVKSKIMRRWKL